MTPTLKLTLKLLLPAALILLLLSSTYVYFEGRPERALLEETTARNIELSTQRFQARLGFAASDLKVVSNFLSLKLFLDRGEKAPLQKQFFAFIEDKPFYRQIRYIDEQGREQVRADLKDGKARIISGESLERKAGRHFFETAMKLPVGQVSISPLDLRFQNDKLEQPLSPVLRFSTRVADSEGRPRGIVVLTYDANIFLELPQAPVAAAEIYVTNDKGQFLQAPAKADEFLFMFPEKPQSTFASRFSDVWQHVIAEPEGKFESASGLYFFSTLNAKESDSEAAFKKHKTVDAEQWKLIVRIPREYFNAQRARTIEWLFYFNFIAVLLLLPLIYYYASMRVHQVESQRQIERMKDEFVSVVSHELRTPLTSIRGALGLLNTEQVRNDPDKSRRMLELALSNSDRLVHLINNILDLERLRSGNIELDVKECNSRQLLVQAAETMRGMAEKQHVVLQVKGKGHAMKADAFRLSQVLTNLLGNAIKYSPNAGVVELWSESRDSEVVFGIKDQGRGIPPNKKDEIFGRFQQVDASDSRAMGGSGLGLAISKSIVQQHRGRIWVESEPEKGSTFYVAIPRG